MKFRLFFSTLLVIALIGCADAPKQDDIQMLGSTYRWYGAKISVLQDFTVSGLRIRVSRSASFVKDMCVKGEARFIELDGPINKDTSFILEKILSSFQHCELDNGAVFPGYVYMNSNGGTLSDGFLIGRTLRKHDAFTALQVSQRCASACAVAFLGGTNRSMHRDARLIFHSPYIKINEYGVDKIKCADRRDANDLLKYYKEMLPSNAADKLFERTMDYCSQEAGWTLDAGAASFFNVTSN
jgi:ATP-dependent protease ClpP protease subunit